MSASGNDLYERGMASLSARERTVLHHLMHGRPACEIAKLEYVTLATVRSQIRSILWKLEVTSQLAAVAIGYRSMATPCTGCPRVGERLVDVVIPA